MVPLGGGGVIRGHRSRPEQPLSPAPSTVRSRGDARPTLSVLFTLLPARGGQGYWWRTHNGRDAHVPLCGVVLCCTDEYPVCLLFMQGVPCAVSVQEEDKIDT